MMKKFVGISKRFSSSLSNYKFENINVTCPREFVYQVELNNPDSKNAINSQMWYDIKTCFNNINDDKDCRSVVLSGTDKVFCSGIDISLFGGLINEIDTTDVGRRAFAIRKFAKHLQDCFLSLDNCLKPIIAAIQGPCIGAGLNMVCFTDIRLGSEDAWFQLKETKLGIPADLGALQLLPKLMTNQSLVNELIYTGRKFTATEALNNQFISPTLYKDKSALIEASLDVASQIAEMSPIAVQSSKAALKYSRNNPSVEQGLCMQLIWNQSMLQSEDFMTALSAMMQKTKPVFSKL